MTFFQRLTGDFEQRLMRVATIRGADLGCVSNARKTSSANPIVGDSRAYVLHDNARSHNQGCRLFGVSNKKNVAKLCLGCDSLTSARNCIARRHSQGC